MDAFGMVEESAALISVENVQQKLELLGIRRFDESPFLSSQAKLLNEALRQSCKTSHKLHVFEELLSEANFDVPLNFIWERLHTGHWSRGVNVDDKNLCSIRTHTSNLKSLFC